MAAYMFGDLSSKLESAIAALSERSERLQADEGLSVRLSEIIDELHQRRPENEIGLNEPIRTIHHFSCTGGTLIARCVEAMPNTILLSEVDPFSELTLKNAAFAPHDIIKLAQIGIRPLSADGVEDVFLGALKSMKAASTKKGRHLVLREHTHSQFCLNSEPGGRPLLCDILAKNFHVICLLTVRHPLDSYISLKKNGWVSFLPDTLDEYCRRYSLFLDSYDDAPIVRYEDFVDNPDGQLKRITKILSLAYFERWRELLPVIKMTGDSGRKGAKIERRDRRSVGAPTIEECSNSKFYWDLCNRLGYIADPESPPLETDIVVK